MRTVSQLATLCGLSRTTLLYYERVGLLLPTVRSGKGYRLYDTSAEERLQRICRYRAAGIPLEAIRQMLDGPRTRVSRALEDRLRTINGEISALRSQQQTIIRLLRQADAQRASRVMTKERWVQLLRASGLSETDMVRWHRVFESESPEAHQDFLESLGISPAEIEQIRNFSRQTDAGCTASEE